MGLTTKVQNDFSYQIFMRLKIEFRNNKINFAS
jgi:hypothetical protein